MVQGTRAFNISLPFEKDISTDALQYYMAISSGSCISMEDGFQRNFDQLEILMDQSIQSKKQLYLRIVSSDPEVLQQLMLTRINLFEKLTKMNAKRVEILLRD